MSQGVLVDDNLRADEAGWAIFATTVSQRGVLVGLTLLYIVVVVRTAWICNDAMITLRMVDNVLQGYGPVWNVAERVQAYTHPLWLALLVAVTFVTRELYYTTILISLALSVVAVSLVAWRVARTLTGAVIALLIFTASKAFVEYSTSGLENPLLHVLLAVFFILYFRPTPTRRSFAWLSFVAGLIILTRMDAALLVLPAWLVAFWPVRSWKAVGLAVLALLPVALWELFSLFYYGSPFPNTAYAKLNAGIDQALMTYQGFLYVLRLVDIDPLTAVVILAGLALPLIRRSWRRAAIALGILLYLVYIVRIGGDFMAGRFFAAPLFCAAAIIARERWPAAGHPAAIGAYLAVVAVGLLSPQQAPLLANAGYRTQGANINQIEDMRGHHFWDWGLLRATETNRLGASRTVRGLPNPAMYDICVGMGPLEYLQGAHVFVVDTCGLTKPLLARLPAIHTTHIFAGHYFRTIPAGYLATLRTGVNQIQDPNLAAFYDKIALITRGDRWDPARLQEIVRLNLGAYDGLIDADRYRYPDRLQVTADALAKERFTAEGFEPPRARYVRPDGGYRVGGSGVEVDLGETRHESHVELGFDGSYFTVICLRDGEVVDSQQVGAFFASLGDDDFTVLTVPPAVAEGGYDALRIVPELPGEYRLAYAEPFDAGDPQLDLERLLHLYTYAYFRADKAARAATLSAVRERLPDYDAAAWAKLDARKRFDLLRIPAAELQAAVSAATPAVALTDADGTVRLRFLAGGGESIVAQDVDDTDADASTEWRPALQLHLGFEVVEPPAREFSAWFHIENTETGREFMVYDEFPDDALPDWPAGDLYEFAPSIFLQPGKYDITFGFWTPGDRERLYVDGGDAYWIDLGTFEVTPP